MRKLFFIVLTIVTCWFASHCAQAQQLQPPQDAIAGQPARIGTSGSGHATLFLIGPGQVIRQDVKLGGPIEIKGEDLKSAGRWIAVLRDSDNTKSKVFWVKPGPPANLSFLARPSRVPVNHPDVITGVAYVFDKNHNLVLQPEPVKFSLSVNGSGVSRTVTSNNGIAWINTSSAKKAGAAQFVASVGDVSVRRVVQQVAADPCNLRMHVAQRTADKIVVVTDPVRDCTGNPVPDGTIVSFIENDSQGKSTVDARIKKGIAQAELPASNDATITVAAGVVLGNELHIGGAPGGTGGAR